MFIVTPSEMNHQLRRSEICQSSAQRFGLHSAPTELRRDVVAVVYKHFVPTGLR
jgi:hypothetical protein